MVYLEVKMEQARVEWCIFRRKSDKQNAIDVFTVWNAISKKRLRYLKVKKPQEKCC